MEVGLVHLKDPAEQVTPVEGGREGGGEGKREGGKEGGKENFSYDM